MYKYKYLFIFIYLFVFIYISLFNLSNTSFFFTYQFISIITRAI